MKRTITAFYKTRADAQTVSDALRDAKLGAEIEIVDQSAADAHPQRQDFVEWLGGLFGGHEDWRAYEEGLRRGHFLLTAKVDETKETRAAEVLDAVNPIVLEDAQRSWRADGWEGPDAAALAPSPDSTHAPSYRIVGIAIRSYSHGPTP
jgi:hypothetical protein